MQSINGFVTSSCDLRCVAIDGSRTAQPYCGDLAKEKKKNHGGTHGLAVAPSNRPSRARLGGRLRTCHCDAACRARAANHAESRVDGLAGQPGVAADGGIREAQSIDQACG